MNWGRTLFMIEIATYLIWPELFGKVKIGTPKFYFGDNLDSKFITGMNDDAVNIVDAEVVEYQLAMHFIELAE